MNAFCSPRRIALLGLAAFAPAVQAGDFYASGDFTVTSAHGNRFELIATGDALPGGSFTATAEGKHEANGKRNVGDVVMDFGGGDTLTFYVVTEPNSATGLLEGTYVITSGTGTLAEASGSGTCRWLGQPVGGTGPFEFSGTLEF
jgi:hypothetical protein